VGGTTINGNGKGLYLGSNMGNSLGLLLWVEQGK
jgi:hypothetical protein